MAETNQKKRIKSLIINLLSSSIRIIRETKKETILKGGGILILLAVAGFAIFQFNIISNGYLEWKYTHTLYENALAKMPVDYSFLKPFRNWNAKPLELNARSAISYLYTDRGTRILFAKNINQKLPIASLSKLFTSYLSLKSYDLKKKVKITKKIIETEENIGQFSVGERLTVEDLLHSALIESSNDAAMALASIMGERRFTRLLNIEVKSLGLRNTFLADPVGLDPNYPGQAYNHSTSYDLAKFVSLLVQKSKTDPKLKLMWQITRMPEYYLYRPDGSFHHKMINTNKLLKDYKRIIIGGKTGYTPMAKECFVMIIKSPAHNNDFIVNVVLGSNNRFKDMKKLINWVNKAYIW